MANGADAIPPIATVLAGRLRARGRVPSTSGYVYQCRRRPPPTSLPNPYAPRIATAYIATHHAPVKERPTMSKIDQPKGIIRINYNAKARTNPSAPFLVGKISTPEKPDALFPFALFHHTDDNGQPYFIGPVSPSLTLRGALAATANSAPNAHFAVMRSNGFKVFAEMPDGKPNPAFTSLSADKQALENAKPAFWGSWARNGDDALLRFSAWDRGQGNYGLWASGNVQHPLTNEEAEALRKGDTRAMRTVLDGDADTSRAHGDEPPFPAHPDDERDGLGQR
jgi:hypothetical protein